MTFVIMGPQGCGKGTQAKMLAEEFGVEHVSIGDVLRREVSNKTPIGVKIGPYMREGKLIPAELNKEVVKNLLEKNKNVLLDGFPRSLDQAKFLLSITNLKAVIVINISEEESLRRLSKRVICTATGKMFIEGHVPQSEREKCLSLGGEIVKRDDDRPEAISKRLEIYREITSPVISFFKENNVEVIEVDGERDVESLFNIIKEKAGHLFSS